MGIMCEASEMIGFLDRIFGRRDPNRVRCAKCRAEMIIISGMVMEAGLIKHAQSCIRCGSCGRHQCYPCSDNRRACTCGVKKWENRMYISADDMKRYFPDAEIFEASYAQMRGIRSRSRR